eukprot:Gb_15374 [translate_table: standard]
MPYMRTEEAILLTRLVIAALVPPAVGYGFSGDLIHYSALFYTVEGHDVSSSIQGVSPLSAGFLGATSPDSSPPDTYRAPPRPLPYDADPRYVRLQRDGLVSRRDKIGSHLHGESEPLRRSNSDGDGEPLTTLQRRNGVDYDDQDQGYRPESPGKRQSLKAMMRIESTLSLLGDEDVCPTCLDGAYRRRYSIDITRVLVGILTSTAPFWSCEDIMKKILKYQHSVDTIFILAVFMNGWKEAKTVQSVTRFGLTGGNCHSPNAINSSSHTASTHILSSSALGLLSPCEPKTTVAPLVYKTYPIWKYSGLDSLDLSVASVKGFGLPRRVLPYSFYCSRGWACHTGNFGLARGACTRECLPPSKLLDLAQKQLIAKGIGFIKWGHPSRVVLPTRGMPLRGQENWNQVLGVFLEVDGCSSLPHLSFPAPQHPMNVYTLGCGSVDDGRVAMGSKAKSAVGKNLRVSSDLKKVILKQKSELPDGFKKTLHGLKGNSLENNLLWGDTAEDELFIPLDSSTKERSLDWSQDDSTEVTHSVEAIQPCTDILSCAVVVAPNEEWKVQVTSQVTPAALSPPCIQGFQQNGVEKGFFKDERRSSFKNAPCYTPKVVPIPQVMDSQIGNELDPFRDLGHIFYIAPPLDNIPVVLPPANSMHGSVQGLLVSFHQGMVSTPITCTGFPVCSTFPIVSHFQEPTQPSPFVHACGREGWWGHPSGGQLTNTIPGPSVHLHEEHPHPTVRAIGAGRDQPIMGSQPFGSRDFTLDREGDTKFWVSVKRVNLDEDTVLINSGDEGNSPQNYTLEDLIN